MAFLITMGSVMQCTFGTATCTLVVKPDAQVNGEQQPVATIMDHKSGDNIPGFGLCVSLANPAVAAATAAAGHLVPMPCMPATNSPWTPGVPGVTIKNKPVVNDKSTCACTWAGTISFSKPLPLKTKVPPG